MTRRSLFSRLMAGVAAILLGRTINASTGPSKAPTGTLARRVPLPSNGNPAMASRFYWLTYLARREFAQFPSEVWLSSRNYHALLSDMDFSRGGQYGLSGLSSVHRAADVGEDEAVLVFSVEPREVPPNGLGCMGGGSRGRGIPGHTARTA